MNCQILLQRLDHDTDLAALCPDRCAIRATVWLCNCITCKTCSIMYGQTRHGQPDGKPYLNKQARFVQAKAEGHEDDTHSVWVSQDCTIFRDYNNQRYNILRSVQWILHWTWWQWYEECNMWLAMLPLNKKDLGSTPGQTEMFACSPSSVSLGPVSIISSKNLSRSRPKQKS